MPTSPRATLRAALSLASVLGLAAAAVAQQPKDAAVRKTTAQGPASAPPATFQTIAKEALAPAPFGTIDVGQVMRGYDKAKVLQEKLQADMMAEQEKLIKLGASGKDAVERLQRFKPGSEDYKKLTEEISDIKAKLDSKKEQLQGEFEMRYAEAVASSYAEVQQMAEAVAKQYKMAYVVKVSREPIVPTDRNTVESAINQPLIYSDSATDITKEVSYYLNVRYQRSGGVAPKSGTASSAPAGGAPAMPKPR